MTRLPIPTEVVKTATGPTILLRSGHYFDLLDPHASDFTIEDIAHGLAKTCRFAGQCDVFYSVAEHCVHASHIVPQHLARGALMHDAAEAFIGDVTRPLKSLLPEYKVIERRIEAAICDRFGVHGCDVVEVKQADLWMLYCEQRQIMAPHTDDWAMFAGVNPLGTVTIEGWAPPKAAERFLDRYVELSR